MSQGRRLLIGPLLAAALGVFADLALAEQVLRLGIQAYRPEAVMRERFQPLADYLSDRLPGARVELRVLSLAALEQAVRAREVDLVLTNPRHYLQLRGEDQLAAAVATLVKRGIDGVPANTLGGVIVALRERDDLSQLSDLKGRQIAIPGKQFTGGYLAPLYEMQQAGLPRPKPDQFLVAGSHDAVLDAVLSGAADVGFLRTEMLEELARDGRIDLDQLKVINPQSLAGYPFLASTRLYPEWPLVVLSSVDPPLVRPLLAALFELEPHGDLATEAGIAGFDPPSDYASVERALRALRLPPFDHPADYRLSDLWQDYGGFILLLGMGVLVILGLSLLLVVRNRRLKRQRRALEVSERFIDALFESVPMPIFYKDVEGRYVRVNRSFERFIGAPRQHVIGKTSVEISPSELAAVYMRKDRELLSMGAGAQQRYSSQVKTAQGDLREVVFDKVVLVDDRAEPVGSLGTILDITESSARERLVQLQMRRDALLLRLSLLIETNDEERFMQLVLDQLEALTESRIGFLHVVNEDQQSMQLIAWSRRTLHEACELGTEGHFSIRNAGIWAEAVRQARPVVVNDYAAHPDKHELPDGHAKLSRLITVPVLDHGKVVLLAGVGNKPSGYTETDVETLQLISDQVWRAIKQQRTQKQLEYTAHYDALTGLPNRVLLAERMQQALAQSRRSGTHLAVLYFDLDGFKQVNDRYGHAQGDELLRQTAQRMRQALREVDVVARLGGDEFAAVIGGLQDARDVVPELERLLQSVGQPVDLGETKIKPAISIGVAFYPQQGEVDADLLLRQADQAMYQAKLNGRHGYELFNPSVEQAQRLRLREQNRLRQALVAGELVFYYQPKVNLLTGQLIGAEALVRWADPERGLLPPAAFLDEARNYPLLLDEILRLGIADALEVLATWQQSGQTLALSVNAEASCLKQDGFHPWLRHRMSAYPWLEPGQLIIELLETRASEHLGPMRRAIEEVAALGVEVALDDFGTGYGSLTYLRHLPAQEVKIDRSFVQGSLTNLDDFAILEAVLSLSRAFQRRVVAEGIESLDHGELLIALGCELGQGFAIARPMPAADLQHWVNRWQPPQLWQRTRPIARADFPALLAMVQHRAWVHALELGLQERERPKDLREADCQLGRWIEGALRQGAGSQGALEQIAGLHQGLHRAASAMIEHSDRGDWAAADRGMDEVKQVSGALSAQMMVILQPSV